MGQGLEASQGNTMDDVCTGMCATLSKAAFLRGVGRGRWKVPAWKMVTAAWLLCAQWAARLLPRDGL